MQYSLARIFCSSAGMKCSYTALVGCTVAQLRWEVVQMGWDVLLDWDGWLVTMQIGWNDRGAV